MESRDLEKMYDALINYEEQMHIQNQKRIKIGLRCLLIIPWVFMFLLFITDSSKVIFLVLWIVSLFGIAICLIAVEYIDYSLQEKITSISGRESQIDGLVDTGTIDETRRRMEETVAMIDSKREEKIENAKEMLDQHKENMDKRREAIENHIEEQKEAFENHIEEQREKYMGGKK